MIKANLAGICYPAQRRELLDSVRGWFDKPDSAPWVLNGVVPHETAVLRGVISPHIDFRVNTSVYTKAFGPWLQAPPADKVLILGVGHHAMQEWSLDGRGYVTPLGEVHTDKAGMAAMVKKLPSQLWGDSQAHMKEHSIEFPLICLQTLRELRGITTPFEFVPVLCGGLFQYIESGTFPPPDAMLYQLAQALREWWDEAQAKGQRVELVVSIDGCHIGPRFGHDYEVNKKILKECSLWEDQLWAIVEQGDLREFLLFLHQDRNARYFDGVGALALVMTMFGGDAKAAGIRRSGYAQWFEQSDSSAVTFSSGVTIA